MSQVGSSKYGWIRPGVTLATMLAAVIATGVALFGMWNDTHGDLAVRCLASDAPGAAIGARGNVYATYASLYPAGRYCLWEGYDGTIAIEQTGWVTTWIALGFLALAVGAFVATIGTEWWIPAGLLMLLVLGGWVTMWAMSTTFLSPVFWTELPPSQLPPTG